MSDTGRLLRIGFQLNSGECEASVAASTGEPVEQASVEFEFLQGSAAAAAAIKMNDEKSAATSEDQRQAADSKSAESDEQTNANATKAEKDSADQNSGDEDMRGEAGSLKDRGVAVKTEETGGNVSTEAGEDSTVPVKKEKRDSDNDDTNDEDKPEMQAGKGDKAASHPHAHGDEPGPQAASASKEAAVAVKPRVIDDASSEDPHRQPAARGFRLLGIEFAPLNTPMRRRLQTLAVAQWLLSIAVLPVLCVLLMFFLLFTPLAPLVLGYIGWVFVFDRTTSQRGGRRWERVRRWSLWRHYRDYFPIRLVKSAELDPSHNYLIGYHPHGIISCGAFCNFGTEATGFSDKFPGIRPYLLTLRMNFFWPLLRAYYMSAGLCDVSRPSIKYILGREGGGNAAIIVVGGAQEALDARPGDYRLTLLNRKGFARMALQTGAHLVPCFSFGENDLFRQAANPPGSRVRAFQQLFKGRLGSSPPLFYGRGIFNYNFGLLPFRHEVSTIVGAPIPVTKCPEPTAEQVDVLHNAYMAQLSDLFDQYKGNYGVPDEVKLEFV